MTDVTSNTTTTAPRVGAVAIGRNEGARLDRCLRSLIGDVDVLVYVDSQSSDDSVALAKSLGVGVVELDMSVPFTAARARNAGFGRVKELCPDVDYVQFVDGDCTVAPGWVAFARQALVDDPDLVAVTGVRRELYPERSLYNEVCDVEWTQGAYGKTTRFGGDVMIRVADFERVGGYNPRVIAAEDDELAIRLCQDGGLVLRVNRLMTKHDAAMSKLSQWWKRATRCGYGYAQVGGLHGATPARKFRGEQRRVMTWGLGVPVVLVALARPTVGASLMLFGVYPLRAARIARRAQKGGLSSRASVAWGLSCAASSIPEAVGLLKYHLDELFERTPHIIEYKGPESP